MKNIYRRKIEEQLHFLYGENEGARVWEELEARLDRFRIEHPGLQEGAGEPSERLSERDSILITYGDQLQEPEKAPLQSLAEFAEEHLEGAIRGIHLLPFFPYSSDDGFSVIDFRAVDPALGTWEDVARVGRNFKLMVDGVINHISRESEWFQRFCAGDPAYRDYFIIVEPGTDLSRVVRPRSLPLLTPVQTPEGELLVWTTFSDDQIDLNYQEPRVLLEVIDILLFYAEKGAEIIRLDAIAYLWKEVGTTSIHLPKTHAVVKLLRAVFELVAPRTLLITETNVPHEDNISYFGERMRGLPQYDEAQMVYQFPLAPLVLHSFLSGEARVLLDWVETLETPSPETAFFNFIASHDGIGVMPARGLLAEAEIQALVDRTLAHGGRVSHKSNPDGSESVYELNITLYDALNDPRDPSPALDIRRFLASQAIMLSLAGVPGIYVHSLFGSRNCAACLEETGRARSLNREKFQRGELQARLQDPASRTSRVFTGYLQLLRARARQPAFDPAADQDVLHLNPQVFSLVRRPPGPHPPVICLINISPETPRVSIELADRDLPAAGQWMDVLSQLIYTTQKEELRLQLDPYQVVWLVPR